MPTPPATEPMIDETINGSHLQILTISSPLGNRFDAMLKKEKEKASKSSTSLDLKPSYLIKVTTKLYSAEYNLFKLQKFDD